MPRVEKGINSSTMLSGIEHAKTVKLAEINDKCENILRNLTITYPDTERLTFAQQKEEAKSFLIDNESVCPMLASMAAARGVPLSVLSERVLAKADVFSIVSGMIIGQRQALEDLLDIATTEDDVFSIEVNYELPNTNQ